MEVNTQFLMNVSHEEATLGKYFLAGSSRNSVNRIANMREINTCIGIAQMGILYVEFQPCSHLTGPKMIIFNQ